MKPTIIASKKGRLTVNDNVIDFDFIINSSGEIMKRVLDQKEGTDHSMKILTLSESSKIYDPTINEMIIGWRSDDKMLLSNEATDFFDEKKCKIKLLPLEEAIKYWNRYEGYAIGLFHISH